MSYNSETEKIRERVSGYVDGIALDIGADLHFEKISDKALGIGIKSGANVGYVANSYLVSYELPELVDKVDVIYSAHILQNHINHEDVLTDWMRLLRTEGLIILYLPDDRLYDFNLNPKAVHKYDLDSFCAWLSEKFPSLKVIDSGLDVGRDRYSFYLVARKMSNLISYLPWNSWANEFLMPYRKITEDDFLALRKLYDSIEEESLRTSIKRIVEEVISVRRRSDQG